MTLSFQCAGAKMPCPNCYGPKGDPSYRCCCCDSTGWVYVLGDEVRVPCPCPANLYSPDGKGICGRCWVGHINDGNGWHHNDCGFCHGLGWTPATDGWDWWRAVKKARIPIVLQIRVFTESWRPEAYTFLQDNYIDDVDPEAAFVDDLHRKLVALGATFPEVEDGT